MSPNPLVAFLVTNELQSCFSLRMGADQGFFHFYRSGKADGARRGNCKIFIAGPRDCVRTGNQMWDDYQQIRKAKCARCGSKHWGVNNACRTTVNYVS